jgi:hypothetical protein
MYYGASDIILMFLFLFQLLQYLIVALSPAISAFALSYSLYTIWGVSEYDSWILWAYFAFYTIFVILHHRPGPVKLHTWMFHIYSGINVICMVFNVYGLVNICIQAIRSKNPASIESLIAMIVVATMGFPYLLAFLHDVYFFFPYPIYHRRFALASSGIQLLCMNIPSPSLLFQHSALIRMLRHALGFYCFLPTLVSLLPMYAFARTWELTWGNRPSEALQISGKGSEKVSLVKSPISIAPSLSNKSSLSTLEMEYTAIREQQSKFRSDLFHSSTLITASIWTANLFIFLISLELEFNNTFLLIISLFVLGWTLMQMFVSFGWISSLILLSPLSFIRKGLSRCCLCLHQRYLLREEHKNLEAQAS